MCAREMYARMTFIRGTIASGTNASETNESGTNARGTSVKRFIWRQIAMGLLVILQFFHDKCAKIFILLFFILPALCTLHREMQKNCSIFSLPVWLAHLACKATCCAL